MSDEGAAVARLAIDVRLSLAMVPAFAPVGWEAAAYERHMGPHHDALPEVLAWHAEHWPTVASFADFASHLDLRGWDTAAWAALIGESGGVGLPAHDARVVAPHDDRQPFARLRAQLDEAVPVLARRALAGRPLPHTRGIGPSTTWNQVESGADRLDATGIVALLAALASLGRDLTLAVGPLPDGSIPEPYRVPLLAAGRWLRRHGAAVGAVEPFDVAGDDTVRYTARPGPDDRTREVFVIDLVGDAVLDLAHFSPHRYPVEDVDGAATWHQDAAGIHLVARPRATPGAGEVAATTYRLTVRHKRARSLLVTGELAGGAVRRGADRYATITDALRAARPGDLVDVPPGRYGAPAERLPLVVPPGVTLVGRPSDQPGADPPTIDAVDLEPGVPAVELRSGAALAHLNVRTAGAPNAPAVVSDGAIATKVERCTLRGGVAHRGGSDHVVAFTTVEAGTISVRDAERATLTGNRLTGWTAPMSPTVEADPPPEGTVAWPGIEVHGGTEHRIDANTIDHVRDGIVLHATTAAVVSANAAFATQQAIVLHHCHQTQLLGNQCRGGRAMLIAGGANNQVTANIADHTDTGLVLDHDARRTVATGNQFVGCRLGLLAWSHHDSELAGNRSVDAGDDGPGS